MDMRDVDVLAGRETDHRFVEAYASYLIDNLTACAEQEGASMEAVLLALICAAVGVSQRHRLEDRVDIILAVLRAGGVTFQENARAN